MKLNIERPIVFFDLETTGIDVARDHIVELCYIKLFPDGKREENTIRIKPVDALGMQIHIPERTTAIHGITDDDVKDCPTFKDISKELETIFSDSDLGGYNSNHFDIPLLVEEFLRSGINIDLRDRKFVDVCVIFKKMEQRTLSAAYKFYCKKDLENAHSALADTQATIEVLEAQLDTYAGTLTNDVNILAEISTNSRSVDFASRIVLDDNDVEVFNFGKYKGKPVKEVFQRDPGYYSWILQGDFPLNTKQVVERLKHKYFNVKR